MKLNYEEKSLFSKLCKRGGRAKLKKYGLKAYRELALKLWGKLSTGGTLTKLTGSILRNG